MGNSVSLLDQLTNLNESSSFAKRWNDSATQRYLFQMIKEEDEKDLKSNPNKVLKKISDTRLVSTYCKQYLTLDKKDRILLLVNHPALKTEDLKNIIESSIKATEKSVYMALASTVGIYALYKSFFQRKALFYNFFRKKSKYKIISIMKFISIGFGIFAGWMQVYSSYYKKDLEENYEKNGLFRKYNIDLEKRIDRFY